MTISGHCFCGFVTYQGDGALFNETSCHCSICRRVCGAPFVAWVSAPRKGFRFTAGQPASFRSSDHGTRTCCPRCGTPLTFSDDDFPEEVDITICSLDDPASVAPQDHTRTSSKLPWVVLGDGLPTFTEARSR